MIPLCNGFYLFPLSRAANSNSLIFDPSEFKISLYLVQYYAAMYYNHSSMRKVHLVDGHVVYVYWIDTVYMQNNIPPEFSKGTIFII